jgi:hypothetical protein
MSDVFSSILMKKLELTYTVKPQQKQIQKKKN